jgi:Protein kinase domain/AAA ATPase domain
MASQGDGTTLVRPARIGGFEVDAVLGRGGMATVYRVTDAATRRPLALKQLDVSDGSAPRADIVALFEREFLVLAQLSHPRIIEVYDYGIDDRAPYYTMELLDGGDLRERSPLPWREACALLSGVCSSLALIHSRRLVHRDVTPANIRCTHDGEAKLIDFGAMAPVGAVASIVGTPAYVAPEVLHRLAFDGRADLFSFGATLYFALTGQSPYPARSFAQLAELWEAPLAPPSRIVEGIPEALDALVLSLPSLEPAMRPRSAFEIMHRLTAIAGIERVEPLSVSQAYLSTPVMVGRDELLHDLRTRMTAAFGGRGARVLIDGVSGVGRSRLLDACAVEAKMLGATVLHASASATSGEGFAVAQMLAEQLLESVPDAALASARASTALAVLFESEGTSPPRLRTLTSSPVPPMQSQAALCDWVLQVTASHPLAIAVDDVNAIDEPSAALLAALASQASRHPLFLIATAEAGSPQPRSVALEVLASRSLRIELAPLTRAQTEDLLGSLFGDAQNLGPVSDGVHGVSAGNPRACMDMARHLVDKGIVSYDGGAWTLPARLDSADLPRTAEDAIRERVDALQPASRWLAEAQALANDTFSRGDYRLLRPDSDPNAVDRAISELLSSHVLVGTDKLHSLAHRGWISALTAGLDTAEREERHRALAALYEDKLPIVAVRHLLAGGLFERALERLAKLLKTAPDASALGGGAQVPSAEVAATVDRALEAAQALGRPARELYELRRWLIQLSVASEDRFYWRVAPAWLEQLERDSGFLFWREMGDGAGAGRLKSAMAAAAQRYAETPESERVYPPAEAVKLLVYYVIASIAIGSRSMNSELLESLPPLLEPFASLSPFADIIRCNALATCLSTSRGQGEQARTQWLDVYERLNTMSGADLPYLDRVRYAVAFGIGSQCVRMGLAESATWAELLDKDPRQRVNALYLRKVIALQMGDSEGAERCRRKAEVLALQSMDRQMFTTTLIPELAAHAFSGDLAGVKQVMARIEPLAVESDGWRGYAELAEALFQQLRGDLEVARTAFARCAARTSRGAAGELRPLMAWAPAVAGHVETLISLERFDEARDVGEAALARCQGLGVGFMSHGISRALALAEAKLGDYAKAVARLEALIAEQKELGVTGLNLGASYEARARIAIGTGDEASFEKYAKLTATEYRHGLGSALGARWERLMAEARRASRHAQRQRRDGDRDPLATEIQTSPADIVSKTLGGALTAQARAERALRLLCDDRTASAGYLYLAGDAGLSLAASLGAAAAPEGLLPYVQEFFDHEVAQNSDQTAVLTTAQTSALIERRSFRDVSGIEHRPLLMASLANGVSRYAGVAVFVAVDGSDRPAAGVTLVGALTAHLIQSGDARVSA